MGLFITLASAEKASIQKKSHFIAIAIVFTVNPYYCPSTICSIAYLTYRQENPWKEMQFYGISSKPQQVGKK